MPFNRVLIYKYLTSICLLVLIGCDGGGVRPTATDSNIVYTDQLLELAGRINFVGEMPNGEMLNFSPSIQYSEMGDIHFTNAETNPEVDINTINLGYGSIMINYEDQKVAGATFDYVYCTTYGDLRLLHPELGIDPSLDEYELTVAIGLAEYDVLDVFNETVYGVDNYLMVLKSPFRVSMSGLFITNLGSTYYLTGTVQKDGKSISGYGETTDSVYNFAFDLECGN